jgi:hypothetical protein
MGIFLFMVEEIAASVLNLAEFLHMVVVVDLEGLFEGTVHYDGSAFYEVFLHRVIFIRVVQRFGKVGKGKSRVAINAV